MATTLPATTATYHSIPKWYKLSLLLPLFLIINYLTSWTGQYAPTLEILVSIVSSSVSAGIFFHQVRHWRLYIDDQRILKREIVLLVVAACALPSALLVGDVTGVQQFGGSLSVGPMEYLQTILWVVAVLAGVFSLANYIHLSTASKQGGWMAFLRVLGFIVYGLLWLLFAIGSYLAYAIVYTSHDPNTE